MVGPLYAYPNDDENRRHHDETIKLEHQRGIISHHFAMDN